MIEVTYKKGNVFKKKGLFVNLLDSDDTKVFIASKDFSENVLKFHL